MDSTRREFLETTANSFLLLSLANFAFSRKLIAGTASEPVLDWLKEVDALARSVKREAISQLEWQSTMSNLFHRVDLAEFLKFIDFEGLTSQLKLPASGEYFQNFTFPDVEGLPAKLTFYKDLAGFRKGCSIPPHGHNHLVSSFLVLRGELRGRQFDRTLDDGDYLQVKQTVDRVFKTGDFSTVSQFKDNVHWFTAVTEGAFIFDFGVGGLKPAGSTLPVPNPNPLKSGRLYLDMYQAEAISGGLQRVKRISEELAYRSYG